MDEELVQNVVVDEELVQNVMMDENIGPEHRDGCKKWSRTS